MKENEISKTPDEFESFSINSEQLAIDGLQRFMTRTNAENERVEKQKVSDFVRHNRETLVAFAGDRTLHFEPSTTAETMAFYPKEGKIEMPTKWFDGSYTNDELRFGLGHEIGHFRDMRKNPEAYLECFDYMEKKGADLAKDYHAKHPEQGSEKSMANFFTGELHDFYNCLDDIYVNKLAMDKAPAFHDNKRPSVVSLYEKIGFKDPDLTGQPLHRQMMLSLLRDEMVGDEFGMSLVDERVEEALSKRKMGKTSREIIDEKLKPIAGILVDPGERYKIIRMYLEGKYLDLLDTALEENNQKNEQNRQGGDDEPQQGDDIDKRGGEQGGGEPQQDDNTDKGDGEQGGDSEPQQGDDFDPFGEMQRSSGILGERTIEEERKILEDIEEQDRIAQMSPEEKAEHIKKQSQEKFDREHNISSKEREEFNNTVQDIKTARNKMKKFWDNLIGKSISFERSLTSGQRKGHLNIDSLIKHYPDFIESQRNGKMDELTIYDRYQTERKIVNKPEEIEISLLVDGSGSMDGKNMKIARDAATLLMLSIKDFNNKLESTRAETHSKLVAKTEVIMFGSRYEKIKDFEKTANFDSTNESKIIKSVSRMQSDYGSTDDASPLVSIAKEVTPEKKTKIDKEKLLKIVFEITDGRPDSENDTKMIVEDLKAKGVLAFAFQIGERNNTFERIWNSSEEKTGIFVGDDIDKLPDSLIQTLSEIMQNVRI